MQRNRPLGQATVAILKAMSDGHRFGLDLMETTGLPSGTVYPTLSRLEERGYIRGTWEKARDAKAQGRPRRRYYALTTDGEAALRQALARFGLLVAPPGTPSPGQA